MFINVYEFEFLAFQTFEFSIYPSQLLIKWAAYEAEQSQWEQIKVHH